MECACDLREFTSQLGPEPALLASRKAGLELLDRRGEQLVQLTDQHCDGKLSPLRDVSAGPVRGGRQVVQPDRGLNEQRRPQMRAPGQVLLGRLDVLAEQLRPVPPAAIPPPLPGPGQLGGPRRDDAYLAGEAAVPRTAQARR
jgi:hypothetical protein